MPEGLRVGVGFLGRGSEPPPHQLWVLGSAVSFPSGVRGGAPKKIGLWCILGLNFAVFHVLSGRNLGGTNNIGVPRTVISGGGDASPPLFTPMVNKKLSYRLRAARRESLPNG